MLAFRYVACSLSACLLLAAPAAHAAYPDCISGTATPAAVTAWRAGAVTALTNSNNFSPTINPVAAAINKCFPTQVPSCLVRTYSYASRNDVADSQSDPLIDVTPQKQPPSVLLAPNAQGLQYFVPQNLEAIAKANGWLTARYKSRHSGGFDPGTASLLMVYVPGDKVTPMVTYDRWLNFALPADVDPDTMNPVPQKQFPSAADYAAENTTNANYPSTFTMITLDRATGNNPSRVYFQKFDRTGNGNGIWTPEQEPDLQGCVNCHPNGMRWISPLGWHVRQGEAQLPPDIWNAVLAINTAMDDDSAGRLTDWRMGTKAIFADSSNSSQSFGSGGGAPGVGSPLPVPASAPTPTASLVDTPTPQSGSGSATYPTCPSGVTPNNGFGWVTTQSLCQQSSTTSSQFASQHGCSCTAATPNPVPVASITNPVATTTTASPATTTYPLCPDNISTTNTFGWVTTQSLCAQSPTTAAQFASQNGCSCTTNPQLAATPPVQVTASSGGTYPVCPSGTSLSSDGWGWDSSSTDCNQSPTTAAQFAQSQGCSCNTPGGGGGGGSTWTPLPPPQVIGQLKLPLIRPGSYWPVLGPLKPVNKVSRTQAFIMGGTLPDGTVAPGCYKSRTHIDLTDIFGRPPGKNNIYDLSANPQINWTHVRNAMVCESCHNNRNRYTINDQSDQATVDFKILVDQSMPLGAHQDPLEQGDASAPVIDALTPDERIALANCLQEELNLERPLVSTWLTQQACQ